jgi:subtilase family serine protease
MGAGSGSVSGAGTYSGGQIATVTATTNSGSTFAGWTGPNAGECATGSVLMNGDKSCTARFATATGLPDLAISALSTGTVTANAGSSILVSNTILNQDGASAGRSVTAFHLSADTSYGNGDDVISATTQTIGTLSAWDSTFNITSVVIPVNTPAGTYHVCAKADDDVTGTYSVAESNETNNARCTDTTFTVPIPDLIETSFTNYNSSVHQGGTITVVDGVKNQGGSTAPASAVGYVLSPNSVIGDSDDIVLPSTRAIASLVAGASSKDSIKLTVPASVPPGTYYVGVIADVGNAVNESNETNNTLKAARMLTVSP